MTQVLLVDDNNAQRKLSRLLLEDAGYHVEDAASAADALRRARARRPDVIISDVMMDHVDGFGLCRRLQEDTGLASIPIVLVSAHYDDDEARKLAKTLGASALIGRTPDFSAEMRGVASCVGNRARRPSRPHRENYEAHLASNAKQLTKLLEQTRRAELRWRTVFENANDTLTLLTPEGMIVEANNRWAEAIGIPPAAMIGHHVRDFAAAGKTEQNVAEFQRVFDDGSVADQFVALRHANGSTVYMEFASCVIDVDGAPHVISIGRDQTAKVEAERRAAAAEDERRKLEERLTHAQRLDTIGQLTGGIAHDFNNVLCAILTSAQFLIEDLGESDARREDAQAILDAAKRATALANQLLAFSRRQVIELVDLDVGSVVRSVSRMLRRLLGGKIELAIDEQSGMAMVRGDVVQLEQVILNLAVNARDAMPAGGKLTISTAIEYVGAAGEVAAGEYIVLSVTDTGCGMDEDTRRRLFEPFFTTKERGHGTGLGLSTSYGIVKQLGGTITVSSELDRGTTMKVYLPRMDSAIGTPAHTARRPRRLSSALQEA